MLKGISELISPNLLKYLHEMGHGDELLLADAHFPGHSCGPRVLRADGIAVAPMLTAILPLLELDYANDSLALMQVDQPDVANPQVEADYLAIIRRFAPATQPPVHLDRAAFYTRASRAALILMTAESRPYGNLLLRKGVTPSARSFEPAVR